METTSRQYDKNQKNYIMALTFYKNRGSQINEKAIGNARKVTTKKYMEP